MLPNDRPAVWLFAKGYAPDEGGLETYSRSVALAYAAIGYEVWVLTQTSAGPRKFTEPDHPHVSVEDVGAAVQPIVFARALLRAVRERRRSCPAIVHATTWRMGLIGLALRQRPMVVSVHGRELAYPSGLLLALMRIVMARADRVLSVSHTTAEIVLRRCPSAAGRVRVAWNGTSDWLRPTDRSPGPSSSASRVLSFCRLVPRKNISGALKAVFQTLNDGARLEYKIAGRGTELDAIKALASQRDGEGKVEVLGFVTEDVASRLYNEADIFLHPQTAEGGGRDIEGFGIAVADAMACGLAVIVGRAGGPAELIVHGETGLIVDGASTDAIASSLQQLLSDHSATSRMRERAALFAAKHFSWEKHCIAATEGLVREAHPD